MKKKLIDLLTQALSSLAQESGKDPSNIKIEIKENADSKFGDYSTNLAMIASKIFSEDPKKLVRPDIWWKERAILSRSLIYNKRYAEAYKVSINHFLRESPCLLYTYPSPRDRG